MTTKPSLDQLKKLQADPAAFRRVLLIDSDAGPKRLGNVCDDWQKRDFEALDPAWRSVAGHKVDGPVLYRAWIERNRGASKTSDEACMLVWILFASSKRINGVVAAADQDQAKLLKDAVSRLMRLNPWLGDYLEIQTSRIINTHTGSEAVFIASDVASSFGLLIDFAILDETTHWGSRELFDSLLSAAAKKARCVVVSICNAGFMDHWAWTVREAVRTDPAWYFSRLETRPSWITEANLAEQQRLLPPAAFARLWWNKWQSGSGDALNGDDITAAITQSGPMLQRELGFAYVAGVDLSVNRDSSALVILGANVGYTEVRERPRRKLSPINRCLLDAGVIERPRRDADEAERIVHPGTNRLRLADVRIWNPAEVGRIDLSAIEEAIVEANERYQLSAVGVDSYQAEMLVQRLQRRGLPIYSIPMTGIVLRDMASAVLDQFRERNIDLYHQPELLADLRGLRVVEREYGWRLVSPHKTKTEGTQHGDSSTGFALATLCAKRAAFRSTREVNGQLVCWPSAVA